MAPGRTAVPALARSSSINASPPASPLTGAGSDPTSPFIGVRGRRHTLTGRDANGARDPMRSQVGRALVRRSDGCRAPAGAWS